MLFTKVIKLMGLFQRNPSNTIYLPLSIVFGYFHGLIKIYVLIMLNKDSQEDSDKQNQSDYKGSQ
ncbi:hypothetical protein B0T25DRAFT_570868 [Lasiosphaeria hispida]|uniref:Uncharacterized protein n=1 Tax=Lasiosphaeria hispida TaxID=260671 RepID=A0AAJ0MD87_9PEZI|nr:hypothetical protein B0T25DRAFT_570868 [Lasiosphaeria hispida]